MQFHKKMRSAIAQQLQMTDYTAPMLIIISMSIQHTVRFRINITVFKMSLQTSFIVCEQLHNFIDQSKNVIICPFVKSKD